MSSPDYSLPNWPEVRNQFILDHANRANFSGMVIASVPNRVRLAIDEQRRRLDATPWLHLKATLHDEEAKACDAVNAYCEVAADCVALTPGTTIGLALLYGGIRLLPGQEVLTTDHEFSAALRVLSLRSLREGITVRRVRLYEQPEKVTADALVSTLIGSVGPRTRVLAVTWVYSNTGIKLPIARLAGELRQINATRAAAERVLLCVDGVHGFGVEDESFPALGCDFLVSGCHKWICGPRGTGVWCGDARAWPEVVPLVATSSRPDRVGLSFSPGGVQAYEHVWGMEEAFRFLTAIGRSRIQERIHSLAAAVKAGLRRLASVSVVTPMDEALSAGIVCFDVKGIAPDPAVERLLEKQVIATTSSNDAARPGVRHVRVSVSMFNNEEDVETLIRAVASL